MQKKNVEGMFRRKEVQAQQQHDKKAALFDKMLSDQLFSPRTYTLKKNQLTHQLTQARAEIEQRRQEAKRVVGFIGELEQQSPLK